MCTILKVWDAPFYFDERLNKEAIQAIPIICRKCSPSDDCSTSIATWRMDGCLISAIYYAFHEIGDAADIEIVVTDKECDYISEWLLRIGHSEVSVLPECVAKIYRLIDAGLFYLNTQELQGKCNHTIPIEQAKRVNAPLISISFALPHEVPSEFTEYRMSGLAFRFERFCNKLLMAYEQDKFLRCLFLIKQILLIGTKISSYQYGEDPNNIYLCGYFVPVKVRYAIGENKFILKSKTVFTQSDLMHYIHTIVCILKEIPDNLRGLTEIKHDIAVLRSIAEPDC